MDIGPTDAELLIESASDPLAFGQIYDRHVTFMIGFFFRRTGCAETAADLTAETFAAAFVSRRRYRDIGVPALAWLVTIANRQLAHYVRRAKVADRYRRKLGVHPIALTAEDFERVEALADLPQLRNELAEALAQLPESQVEAVRFRVIDQLPYAEVASRLGCTEGAARVRVSRGLTALADFMEPR